MSDSSRLRDSDRRTRVHLTLFDRTKFLTLFVAVYLVLVWANLADNPLLNSYIADRRGPRITRSPLSLSKIGKELERPFRKLWFKYHYIRVPFS